jgi:hypothetical protein
LSKKPVCLEESPVEGLLTEEQVAEIADAPVSAIRKMRVVGDGPAFTMIGKTRVRYQPQAVRDWLKTRSFTSRADYYAANAERARNAELQRRAVEKVRPARWRKPEAVTP